MNKKVIYLSWILTLALIIIDSDVAGVEYCHWMDNTRTEILKCDYCCRQKCCTWFDKIDLIIQTNQLEYDFNFDGYETCSIEKYHRFSCPNKLSKDDQDKKFCCGLTPADKHCCNWTEKIEYLLKNSELHGDSRIFRVIPNDDDIGFNVIFDSKSVWKAISLIIVWFVIILVVIICWICLCCRKKQKDQIEDEMPSDILSMESPSIHYTNTTNLDDISMRNTTLPEPMDPIMANRTSKPIDQPIGSNGAV